MSEASSILVHGLNRRHKRLGNEDHYFSTDKQSFKFYQWKRNGNGQHSSLVIAGSIRGISVRSAKSLQFLGYSSIDEENCSSNVNEHADTEHCYGKAGTTAASRPKGGNLSVGGSSRPHTSHRSIGY